MAQGQYTLDDVQPITAGQGKYSLEDAAPMQAAPSYGTQLTAGYNPGASEFAERHPLLGGPVRFLDASGGAMLNFLPATYHMLADVPTPAEIKQGKAEGG